MNISYLLPHRFKRIGWFVFIPSCILGFLVVALDFEPDWLDLYLPAIFIDSFSDSQERLIGIIKSNFLNEIFGVLIIVSGLFVAFSKENNEDEYISNIRLNSLVWATYVNYAVLIIAILFVYDFTFLWVMIFNMFTILIFFIIRFNWKLMKLKKSLNHEK
ncbi:hypothetical protein OO013_16910 [Mangrovivirga sp. M17]|uniref:Uncharacterized protein n=1 Tax=Mangrovivirga halotolerans TaxID=2993936 RepID=A0ABT3RUX1_9BACT|nr:hypothetical protein [Mangrovivirga halotolerans]MCX2745564.1 hypothetical protein [Mangrovivirga halotolerans]